MQATARLVAFTHVEFRIRAHATGIMLFALICVVGRATDMKTIIPGQSTGILIQAVAMGMSLFQLPESSLLKSLYSPSRFGGRTVV